MNVMEIGRARCEGCEKKTRAGESGLHPYVFAQKLIINPNPGILDPWSGAVYLSTGHAAELHPVSRAFTRWGEETTIKRQKPTCLHD